MKIAVMQPYIFPYIGYFQLINAVDVFILYDDVNFIKQGWINRNNILIQGNKHLFTIPLENASSFQKINEIDVSSKLFSGWVKKFCLSIELAYKKAPYFETTYEIVVKTFQSNSKSISEIIYDSIRLILNYLQISTEIKMASNTCNNDHLKGQDRIIDICRKEQATVYLNAIGGLDLYSKNTFSENHIDLNFIQTRPIIYKQFSNSFVSGLSIIDILMFNSIEESRWLLTQYDLT